MKFLPNLFLLQVLLSFNVFTANVILVTTVYILVHQHFLYIE